MSGTATTPSSLIECLRQYFMQFPGFSGRRLDIDCLDSDPESYSIDCVPAERIVSRYLDGSTVRRQLFTISSRDYFGTELRQQRENIELFEALEAWIYDSSLALALPQLGEKRRARSLNVLSSAYPIEADDSTEGTTARYQIQIELIYVQEV